MERDNINEVCKTTPCQNKIKSFTETLHAMPVELGSILIVRKRTCQEALMKNILFRIMV